MGHNPSKEEPTTEELEATALVKTIPELLRKFSERKKTLFNFYFETWLPQRKSTLSVLGEAKGVLQKRSHLLQETKWLKSGSMILRILAMIFIISFNNIVLSLLVCLAFTTEAAIFKLSGQISKTKLSEKVLLHVMDIDEKNTTQLRNRWAEFQSSFSDLQEEVDDFLFDNYCGCFVKVNNNIPGFKDFLTEVKQVRIGTKCGMASFFIYFRKLVGVSAKGIERRDHEELISKFAASLSLCYSKIDFTDVTRLTFEMLTCNAGGYDATMCHIEKCLSEEEKNLTTLFR